MFTYIWDWEYTENSDYIKKPHFFCQLSQRKLKNLCNMALNIFIPKHPLASLLIKDVSQCENDRYFLSK